MTFVAVNDQFLSPERVFSGVEAAIYVPSEIRTFHSCIFQYQGKGDSPTRG
jgi:hypothetical protein